MYSGEVGELDQRDLVQLVALGRQLQMVGILCSEHLPQPPKHQEEEEGVEDDVFEEETAVDLSPGAR